MSSIRSHGFNMTIKDCYCTKTPKLWWGSRVLYLYSNTHP